jgi:hypothetical protein
MIVHGEVLQFSREHRHGLDFMRSLLSKRSFCLFTSPTNADETIALAISSSFLPKMSHSTLIGYADRHHSQRRGALQTRARTSDYKATPIIVPQ